MGGMAPGIHPKAATPVQVCILDCKAYEELMETGEVEAWPNIDSCVILTGSQGKGLLNPGPGEELSDDKKIQIQLQEGEVGLAPRTVMLCLHACHGPVASRSTCQLGLELSADKEIQIQLQEGEVGLAADEDWCRLHALSGCACMHVSDL